MTGDADPSPDMTMTPDMNGPEMTMTRKCQEG